MSAVKDVLLLTSCSNLCQPIIHSPRHVLETFRPFLVKATGAAQTDFGLLELQVDRKLLLNWICLGVQRNRLCHTAGPVQLMNPIPLCAIKQTPEMTLQVPSWQHGVWALGMFA